jgi:transcriptional regulator with XRE-family HTH domain
MTTMTQIAYDRGTTGARLRRVRLTRSMTQAELAWHSGITQAALSNYENGKRDIPVRSLISLARVLGISPIALVPALAESNLELLKYVGEVPETDQ